MVTGDHRTPAQIAAGPLSTTSKVKLAWDRCSNSQPHSPHRLSSGLVSEGSEYWCSGIQLTVDKLQTEKVVKMSGETDTPNNVTRPSHYRGAVPNIECIEVVQHFNFNRGNVIKYVWRAGEKGDELEDLMKARQYIDFEIARLQEEREEMNFDD